MRNNLKFGENVLEPIKDFGGPGGSGFLTSEHIPRIIVVTIRYIILPLCTKIIQYPTISETILIPLSIPQMEARHPSKH